jgi:hypothetical protein
MTSEAMNRLRRANPALADAVTDDDLFRAIVSGPGDPRLAAPQPRFRRKRALQIAVALGVLLLGVGAAWAAAGGALEIFEANPQGRDATPASLWDQDVDPSSVVRAAVISIPRYGDVEYWYADAKQGGWCGAIRLPNGTWAATKESGIGGTVPGCYPTREQTNAVDPVFVINGFDYYEDQVDARDRGGLFWRVYYGILTVDSPVASVVDRLTGRHAKLQGGKRFAIAVPDSQPGGPPESGTYALDLVAYDAAGRVVAEEHPDDR